MPPSGVRVVSGDIRELRRGLGFRVIWVYMGLSRVQDLGCRVYVGIILWKVISM